MSQSQFSPIFCQVAAGQAIGLPERQCKEAYCVNLWCELDVVRDNHIQTLDLCIAYVREALVSTPQKLIHLPKKTKTSTDTTFSNNKIVTEILGQIKEKMHPDKLEAFSSRVDFNCCKAFEAHYAAPSPVNPILVVHTFESIHDNIQTQFSTHYNMMRSLLFSLRAH